MIFCEHCFNDKEIASIIRKESASYIGKCPVCGYFSAHLYDSRMQDSLTPIFEDLLDMYKPLIDVPKSSSKIDLRSLVDDLNDRWNIFSEISELRASEILKSVCTAYYASKPELFEGAVFIPELNDSSYLEEHTLLKNNNWESFVNEIKTKNRYHSKLINFDILEMFCSYVRKTHKAGEEFYRARISGKEGFPTSEMSAPPAGKSSEGRANAKGITCLYVANDVDTTLHEVRAGAFDYVCIGTFRVRRDITIVDLRQITELSPFVEGLSPLDLAINKGYLQKLNTEMSRALRRNDSPLDYVPTQYIVDFIKSIEHNGEQEYDGIGYESTTNPNGYNLAIFNPDAFECISTSVYDIERLEYEYKLCNQT